MLKNEEVATRVLRLQNVGCDRGGVPIIRNLSFEMKPGEAVQLFGRNGAGKSSLLRVLAGLIKPNEGDVDWTYADGLSHPKPPAHSVFFLGHQSPIKAAFTVGEHLAFWRRFYRKSEAVCQAAAQVVELHDHLDSPGYSLSAGQRRRLEFARGLICQRSVWLLDEPTAAIDRDGIGIVTNILDRHLKNGGTAVIATHERLSIQSVNVLLEDQE